MKSILDVLCLSTDYLGEKGVDQPRRQAEELLCDALGMNRLSLYLEFDRPLEEQEVILCRERLIRRANKEPLQYIHGQVEFYNCSLLINPSVLIPRQETEILVDRIVQYLDKQSLEGKVLWDLCCGSGCIGLALKKRFPELHIVLSDLSPAAKEVTYQNARENQLEVEILEGDLLVPFQGKKTHFLVCNPPYLAEHEFKNLDVEVREHEPRTALIAGPTGLEFYERLAQELPLYLHPSAAVWFEIGYKQGERIQALFQGYPWKAQRLDQDWAGHDRFFFLENE
jgi:release factor glutamine methyltransferase